jgi:peptide/nickel transport system ATP-binding protein/oligopeptide transport system ATP-binding protein
MELHVTYTDESSKNEELLRVKDLKVWFPIKSGVIQRTIGYVKAVDGITFNVLRGETLGIVGESGSGKTTLGKSILKLVKPTSGEIYFEGINIVKARRSEMKMVRRRIQMIFQDPYASLDPRQTVSSILYEAMKIHGIVKSKTEAIERAIKLLEIVGLSEEHLYRFPHELSGGQRQRIAIARALAVNPIFLVLDEPTSFLDVSVQASVLNLLKDLQRQLSLTYMFITHNLAVVHHMSDRVAVMYLGKIVEIADKDSIFRDPKHPYTFQLMEAIPLPDPEVKKERVLLEGDVPSPMNVPSGCRFHPRCRYATQRCREVEPQLGVRSNGLVACHYEIDFSSDKIVGEVVV